LESKVLVGIPAYNEAKHIRDAVDGALKYVDAVLVVDDGSYDETARLAREAGAMVISHGQNRGLGSTINTILRFSTGYLRNDDILITMDGDGQHFPEDLLKLIAKTREGYDVVTGSRLYRKGEPGPTPWRRILNGIATYIIRAMCGFRVYTTDSQSGFHAFRYWVVKQLRLRTKEYAWNSELFIWVHKHHAKTADVQVGTIWTPPSTAAKKHATLSYGIKALGRLVFIWMRS
jgi:glycosyltransferase involved in cell wall biosynthesis